MLTPDMTTLLATFPLGFVATVTPEGTPALSPKGTFIVLDHARIAFADIRSPATRRNLAANPAVEVNFIDPFQTQGCPRGRHSHVAPQRVGVVCGTASEMA